MADWSNPNPVWMRDSPIDHFAKGLAVGQALVEGPLRAQEMRNQIKLQGVNILNAQLQNEAQAQALDQQAQTFPLKRKALELDNDSTAQLIDHRSKFVYPMEEQRAKWEVDAQKDAQADAVWMKKAVSAGNMGKWDEATDAISNIKTPAILQQTESIVSRLQTQSGGLEQRKDFISQATKFGRWIPASEKAKMALRPNDIPSADQWESVNRAMDKAGQDYLDQINKAANLPAGTKLKITNPFTGGYEIIDTGKPMNDTAKLYLQAATDLFKAGNMEGGEKYLGLFEEAMIKRETGGTGTPSKLSTPLQAKLQALTDERISAEAGAGKRPLDQIDKEIKSVYAEQAIRNNYVLPEGEVSREQLVAFLDKIPDGAQVFDRKTKKLFTLDKSKLLAAFDVEHRPTFEKQRDVLLRMPRGINP